MGRLVKVAAGFIVAMSFPAVAVAAVDIDSSIYAGPSSIDGFIETGVNTLLTAAGIISVIMIIVGGIMYSLSAGDSNKATKAKDTILYSVIGLVITMLAYAIVNFVIGLL